MGNELITLVLVLSRTRLKLDCTSDNYIYFWYGKLKIYFWFNLFKFSILTNLSCIHSEMPLQSSSLLYINTLTS